MIPNHPIFAYLHASAQETLKSRWSRSTWLIPIRGDFTRLDSRLSRGVIVSNGGLLSKSGTTIYWRELSVRAFWEYLAGTRGSGKFGSIGLSFEATDNAHDPKRRRSNVFSKYCIKVYHDSCYSTQIRTLIDRFKCAEDNDSEAGSGSAKVVGPKDNVKRRILRRAKLLLLNESNQNLLIS